MQAVICARYGGSEVLQLTEVAKPLPEAHEVLIKVHATTVTAGDVRVRGFVVPRSFWLPARLTLGMTRPRKPILGMVVAGEVESVGQAVTHFKPGDQVFAYDITRLNAYAEYACAREDWALALKPSNCSYAEAAAIPFGGVTALYFVRKARIASGQRALIYGAAGGVGSFAVQLARYFGANVTGVCGAANQDFVRTLGADQVIDYAHEDFTQNGQTYDLIFDTVGKTPLAPSLRSLAPGGVYLQAVGDPLTLLRMQWAARGSGKTCIGGTATPTTGDLLFLKELVETGAIKPVIDRCYPLAQMADAHRYVDQGHKRGAVIVTVG